MWHPWGPEENPAFPGSCSKRSQSPTLSGWERTSLAQHTYRAVSFGAPPAPMVPLSLVQWSSICSTLMGNWTKSPNPECKGLSFPQMLQHGSSYSPVDSMKMLTSYQTKSMLPWQNHASNHAFLEPFINSSPRLLLLPSHFLRMRLLKNVPLTSSALCLCPPQPSLSFKAHFLLLLQQGPSACTQLSWFAL